MTYKINEKYRPIAMTFASMLAVVIGALSQSALPERFLKENITFEVGNYLSLSVNVSAVAFLVLFLILLFLGFFIEFSKEADSGEKHSQLESALSRVRSFIGQIALTPPPDFIGTLHICSKDFFYMDRIERTDLRSHCKIMGG
jgi:hypothetical protein